MLDLERLMVLSEKATPGLWVRLRAAYADCLVVRVKDDDKGHDEEYLFSEEDQVFAAMARETMSDLILLATFAVNDLERAELERDQYDAAAEIFGRMVRRLQGQLDEAVDIAADREIERDTLAAKLREAEAREGELREARPEAARFAEEMENQLQANEEKGGWKDSDRRFLLSELTKNYNHLERLLVWFEGPGNVCRSTLISRESEKDILRRAANIANFAMMIADNFGGLMEGAYETLSRPAILDRLERMEKALREIAAMSPTLAIGKYGGGKNDFREVKTWDAPAVKIAKQALEGSEEE